MFFKKQIFWANEIKDDKVVEPYFDVPYCYADTGWGLEIKKQGGQDGGDFHIVPCIEDYERDFNKLKFPNLVVDDKASDRIFELASDIFGDILTVR